MNHALLIACAPALLLPGLDARSFRERERASAGLRAWGPLALPALCHAEAHPRSEEQRRRCSALLSPHWEALCERRSRHFDPDRYPCLPWMLYECSLPPEVVERYCERTGCSGDTGPVGRNQDLYFPDNREATRLWLRDQLRARRPLSEIRRVLDELQAAEKRWTDRHLRQRRP